MQTFRVLHVWGREKVKAKAPLNRPVDPILQRRGNYNTGGSESVNMGHKQYLTQFLMHWRKGLKGGTGCNGKDKVEEGGLLSLRWHEWLNDLLLDYYSIF